MAYAASVGSARAKRKVGALGFIGNATHATAHFFGRDQGHLAQDAQGAQGDVFQVADGRGYHEQGPHLCVSAFRNFLKYTIDVAQLVAGAPRARL